MAEQEGVIKYQLNYQQKAVLTATDIVQLNSWRQIMMQLGMLGQCPQRYDNYGFGNISQRYRNTNQFMISGSQTGGISKMTAADYALVSECVPEQNQITALGQTRPSSEAMTHGQLYQLSDDINFVIHAHCPQIWQQASALGLPQTRAEVPYGTVAMADEVARLFRDTDVLQHGVFSMAGHEDGVVAVGSSAAEAGQRLISCYAAALECATALC
ncbi:Class II Aldolase and Adducin N-terminal domain-containing protein [Arsukibacterium tuosuense]|uniref:Class II Aldolase and Adducin N-terminal domain-containing protein n=1 Tax=Arsukibacterium tuosuense TaxID=1323745 RepID=A0A285JK56_9GAMM|nr:class II aldolase/adducin family protein [Arsukibacterium tuosuense]SNY59736.1 Class II Aldolase and Adducin N-terminal domain-containing protein [Arsukibacterium tuosuense]